MGNCCQSLGKCCGDTKEAPTTTFQPAANRHCTDILFLLLYIASFGGMLAVILVATGRGASPQRIYHGVNALGDTCGSGQQKDRPYNAWVSMPSPSVSVHNGNDFTRDCSDCFYIKTCLNSCSETSIPTDPTTSDMIDFYPTTDYGYFCVPTLGALTGTTSNDTITVTFTFSGQFGDVQQNAARAMGDLYTTWPLILGSAAVALLFAFLYNFLSESIAGVLVLFALIIIIAGGILASYTLIKAGRNAREQGVATKSSDAMYGVGIALAVVTLIFVLVVIALRQRIRIAIEVVKEANRCVHDIWSLIVFPIFPMLAGLGYMVFWIVVTVYIFAVWNTKFQPVPAYIAQSNNFINNPNGLKSHLFFNTTTNTYNYQSYTWDTSMQDVFAYVFFHLLWTVQFVIYFTYMVMAGTVANWYFAPMDANEKRIVGSNPGELSHTPITDSCCRTCRYHIGTIALAAFIIAVVEFIRAVVLYIEKKVAAANGGELNFLQKAVFCLIHCCLACVQCCLDKINKNALVWTAIWGDSFGTAACSSFKLLWGNLARTGAMSIISSFLMFLGKVTIAIATAGFGGIFIHFRYTNISSPVLPMVIIFIIGYVVGSLFMAVFEVAMDTVFLCFLIDEKLHAGSGTMCASKGLRALVDSEEIRKECQAHAAETNAIQERRNKQLGWADEGHGQNNTGVMMQPSVKPNV